MYKGLDIDYIDYIKRKQPMIINTALIDQLHSTLMDDDQFQEALQRITLQIAEEFCADQPCETDEEDVMELAVDLYNRVSVA